MATDADPGMPSCYRDSSGAGDEAKLGHDCTLARFSARDSTLSRTLGVMPLPARNRRLPRSARGRIWNLPVAVPGVSRKPTLPSSTVYSLKRYAASVKPREKIHRASARYRGLPGTRHVLDDP